MAPEMETPGALVGATEGRNGSGELHAVNYPKSAEWASRLWDAMDALAECALEDAIYICASFLADQETEGPAIPIFGMIAAGDVQFWADTAPPHELAAYATAALDRLAKARLGVASRKRLLVTLWGTLTPEDRQAFLARVDPEGQFQRGAAA